MKYIAYGSNMMKDQMAFRCPGARLAGTGHIRGARLEFYLHATVEKTGEETDRVPVAVWEISEADERSLDLYEGYPDYYLKEEWPVYMDDGTGDDLPDEPDSEDAAAGFLLRRHRRGVPEPGAGGADRDGAGAGAGAEQEKVKR